MKSEITQIKALLAQLEAKLSKEEEVDLSILNDVDVFYIKARYEDDCYEYLFKGKNPFCENVNFWDIFNNCLGCMPICDKEDVLELRKATKEEIELYRKHYPKEGPKEIDFSILNDTDVFYMKIGLCNDYYEYLFIGKDPFSTKVNFCDIIDNRADSSVICDKKYVLELRKATKEEIELYRKHYPKEYPKEIDFSILNDVDVFFTKSIWGSKYLFSGPNPVEKKVNFLDLFDNTLALSRITDKKYISELRKATKEEIELYRKYYPIKKKVWIEISENIHGNISTCIYQSKEELEKGIKWSGKHKYKTLEVIEREY